MKVSNYILTSTIYPGCAGIWLPRLPLGYPKVTSGLFEFKLKTKERGVGYLVTYIF